MEWVIVFSGRRIVLRLVGELNTDYITVSQDPEAAQRTLGRPDGRATFLTQVCGLLTSDIDVRLGILRERQLNRLTVSR